MTAALLADRFRLVARSESREMPVLALTLARADRQLGPKLRPAKRTDCDAARRTAQACGLNVRSGRVLADGVELAELAPLLSQFVGRRVLDRSSLPGRYDFLLEWSQDLDAGGPAAAGAPLVTALQEQLGLRLEPKRSPVGVVVVESMERPAEN